MKNTPKGRPVPQYIKDAKLSDLKAKAERLGIADYNVIQRGSRAVNLVIGSNYKPKTILYWEIKAREQGRTTAAYTAVTSVKGVRADVAYTPTFDDAMYFNAMQFQRLGEAVPQIGVLLTVKEGDFLDRNGDVWREEKIGDGSRSIWRNATTGQSLEKRPAGVMPATPQLVRQAIYQIRDIVDARGGASNAYEGYIDIYLSDAD